MRTQDGSEAFPRSDRGCVLTIGNFDGAHQGHRAVIGSAVERARNLGAPAVVYTFEPHPRRVLQPERSQPRLMTPRQLELALEEIGVDLLVRERFTLEFAALTPEAFLREILYTRIGPRELFVGRDFHFGKGRGGSDETLARLAPTLGIRVVIVPEVRVGGRDVSSTRIRKSLALGDVADAGFCLGRPYAVWGRVVSGERRGRELGFPTANLDLENELSPARGVYATHARLFDASRRPAGPRCPSVANIGTRPTFQEGRLLTEVHLIDFEGDLYGQLLEVTFIGWLRSEQRFPGIDALRQQIQADVARARELLVESSE
jgi:riboflavin kinase/FMN adenylyltransferase